MVITTKIILFTVNVPNIVVNLIHRTCLIYKIWN